MDFVNPALLAGVGLAAVPIILHLVMRQKPQRIEFPALRFVRRRREANQRRLRLRQLLLLAARVGFICLVAAALARPSIKLAGGMVGREAPVAAVMVFDTSARMQYRRENKTRLEDAREKALWLLSQLPDESQVAVLDGNLGTAVFQIDLGSAKQRIERLDTRPATRPLTELLDEALRLLKESTQPRKELYVFSDLTRGAWPQENRQPWAERIAALGDTGLYVIDVGAAEPQNYALGEISLSSQIVARHSAVRVSTSIAHEGSGGERGVEIFLAAPGAEPQKRHQETVSLSPGESRAIEFPLSGLTEGTHEGFIRLVGEDGLAVDDIRYFTIEALPAWSVLIAAAPPVDLHALYLEEALAPESFRRNGTARFTCETVDFDRLATEELDRYASIALVDPPPLSPDVWQRLSVYVAGGGSVAIYLGRNAQASPAFNEGPAQDLLPGQLARVVSAETHLAPDERAAHPLWSKFRDLEGSIPWSQFPVHRYWEITPLVEDAGVVTRFADGGSAILERTVGRGRAITMTTPISDPPSDDAWNLLPSGIDAWPFVMLANETTLYLVGSHAARLNYLSGQSVVMMLRPDSTLSTYVLTTPQGDEFRQNVDPERQAIVVSATETPGQYRIRAGGEGGLSTGFSVNLSPDVTALARLDEEEVKATFGESGFQIVREREEIDRQLSAGRVGYELYGWLIALAALVLAGEYYLANRFYRPATADAQSTLTAEGR